MSISSLLIHTLPADMGRTRNALSALTGVEVHGETPKGHLIVTVDDQNNARAADTMMSFREMDGVLSTSLVYTYFDEETAEAKKEHAA